MNQQSHDAQKIIDAFNAEVEKAIAGKESPEEIADAINSCNRRWLYALFPTTPPFAMEALLLMFKFLAMDMVSDETRSISSLIEESKKNAKAMAKTLALMNSQ